MENQKSLVTIYEVIRLKQERKPLPQKYQGLYEYRANSPKAVHELVIKLIGDEDREVFLVIGLNIKNQVISVHRASVGTINSAIVHPREIFKTLILNNCASFIVAHVHPSGNVLPSPEDISITTRLKDVGDLMGIDLLDHIIVANNDYFSLHEKGYF